MSDGIIIIDLTETDYLTVIDLGPAGVVPLIATFNTVSLLSQSIVSNDSALVIDRSLGEYVNLSLQADISSFSVINWPISGYLGRIHLDIINTGNYTISFSKPGYMASYAFTPVLTANGRDMIILTTVNEGRTVLVNVAGQNYQSLA